MGAHQKPLKLFAVVVLLNASFAGLASSVTRTLHLKVIRADVHALAPQTPVPKDCDLSNFSAYCNNSTNPTEQVVMLVQDADGKFYNISCVKDSRWSNCSALPEGAMFDARVEKQGITVRYRTPKGKEKKQVFQLIGPVPPPKDYVDADSEPAPQPVAAPAQRTSAATASAPVAAAQQSSSNQVRCNFNSIPAGAEITVDGKYVGNTPSALSLSVGTHVVVFSSPGFMEWKRELTVTPGSDLTVSTTLQKAQQ